MRKNTRTFFGSVQMLYMGLIKGANEGAKIKAIVNPLGHTGCFSSSSYPRSPKETNFIGGLSAGLKGGRGRFMRDTVQGRQSFKLESSQGVWLNTGILC